MVIIIEEGLCKCKEDPYFPRFDEYAQIRMGLLGDFFNIPNQVRHSSDPRRLFIFLGMEQMLQALLGSLIAGCFSRQLFARAISLAIASGPGAPMVSLLATQVCMEIA